MNSEHENTVGLDDIEVQLKQFADEQARALGLKHDQYVEPIHSTFTASQRPHTTLLLSGLTWAHDTLASAALRGVGYKVAPLDIPDNAALQFGKEFGNRGQCNPTYFTVGNLVKHLVQLRDEKGLSVEHINKHYAFLTAGACGPCRFGTYATEYRKALRDAGFSGFRVLLFQQQGGVKQATGEELGLKIDMDFTVALMRAFFSGDVVNLMGYRMRPYEVVEGSTDAALAQCQQVLADAFDNQKSILRALIRCRRILAKVEIDRSVPKPKVSIIGEFWAMTTEGDGNYHLQKFLEKEGAEVDVQGLTNWILFMLWENRFDTKLRQTLRNDDGTRKGLDGKDPTKKLWMLKAGEVALRANFQVYAHAIGLYGYELPDMEHIAHLAEEHYSNMVRGGEAHMEVGKVIHFMQDRTNHMTLSVKPFGCMPSSSVSDGVQSLVAARYPEAVFLPIETTGDGAVNVYSRVQMTLFKARQRAREEYDAALAEVGMDEDSFRTRLKKSRRWSRAFWRPKHHRAGVAANLVYAVAGRKPAQS